MQIFREINSLRTYLSKQKSQQTTGLVPTMGALHEGHLALLNAARQDNDVTICSIYVNPTQFNNAADLEKYPRTLEKDVELLEEEGCDAVFCPSDEMMYPQGKEEALQLGFGHLDQVLEGVHRPGHFSGVGLVVTKLFNIVQPQRAYFGQKDLQQFAVIRQLVADFFLPVKLIRVPIVRNPEGLALSSRNQRLSQEEKQRATRLYQSLQLARQRILQGDTVDEARQQGAQLLQSDPAVRVEYFEAVDAESLRPVSEVAPEQTMAFCVAAYVGGVRLIDNIIV
ncbi:MAG: pantoate--beta-alanine ligase [Cyclobacteriaceae bacterium]